MTEIRGVWCSICRRRYAYHLCREGMPCEHDMAEALPSGLIRAEATLIECYAWRYSGGFKQFNLQKIRFVRTVDEPQPKKVYYNIRFSAEYVSEDELINKFLEFLKTLPPLYWPTWVEAFVSTLYGGPSATSIPRWREKQLLRRQLHEDMV